MMRLPFRHRTILLGLAVIAISFFASLKLMDWLAPRGRVAAPVLVALPPLPPVSRSSTILATDIDFDSRHSRRRRARRTAQVRGQG